jgi:hypothetical protein
MPYIDQALAQNRMKQRQEAKRAADRRMEACHEAQAEAERTKSGKPFISLRNG